MSDLLEYKDYCGTVEFSAADNILFGKVIGVKSLISYEGVSLQSLKEDFESTIDEYLEMCYDNKMKPEEPYGGSLSIKISPELHKTLSLYADSREQSINSTVEEALNYLFAKNKINNRPVL